MYDIGYDIGWTVMFVMWVGGHVGHVLGFHVGHRLGVVWDMGEGVGFQL